ncbi:MAG: DUF805 domain-containing protein [Treponema sp.]|jgi:uncharacterized membrane protein YhaH (DUF805 family)|nr:DUF805 domain-containing protein [Treponema sp.]
MEQFWQPYLENYIGVLKKYAVFEGRAGRWEFWWFFLCSLIIGVAAGILSRIPLLGWVFSIGFFIFCLATLIPNLAVGARRLHDTNRSGWLLLLSLIPLAGIIILIVFWAMEGDSGKNQYGACPARKTRSTTRKPRTRKTRARTTRKAR